MADLITRCPKCDTAFRISEALLKSAKGLVRCGSCLSVFNARDHLEHGRTASASSPTEDTPTPPSASTPPPPQPAPPPYRAEREEDDAVDVPDWRRHSRQEEQDEGEEAFPSSASEHESAGDEEEEDDESWALELLKDDDDDFNIQLKKVASKPMEAPPVAPPAFFVEDDLLSSPPLDVEDTLAEIDEQLAPPEPKYQAPTEPFSEPTEIEASTDIDDNEPTAEPNDPADDYAPATAHDEQVELNEESAELAPTPETLKRKPIRPKLEPKSTPLKDVIASLEPEPLEVDWHEPGLWRRRLLWPLLALVALLCLLAQVAWLEFDRLSRIEPYRSAYSVACRVIGCELPELLDRQQIQTSNLLVRSHPELVDALQVDVILQNNASFEQTFPVLELTFTNLRSEPVATRRLDPTDYLGGELAGRNKMPVRQPIHIALEIADPGSEAVSYHIKIVD